jgi:hypothetical protein
MNTCMETTFVNQFQLRIQELSIISQTFVPKQRIAFTLILFASDFVIFNSHDVRQYGIGE